MAQVGWRTTGENNAGTCLRHMTDRYHFYSPSSPSQRADTRSEVEVTGEGHRVESTSLRPVQVSILEVQMRLQRPKLL